MNKSNFSKVLLPLTSGHCDCWSQAGSNTLATSLRLCSVYRLFCVRKDLSVTDPPPRRSYPMPTNKHKALNWPVVPPATDIIFSVVRRLGSPTLRR